MDNVCGNPFVVSNRLTFIHKMLFIVLAPLAIIRCIGAAICFAGLWISAAILYNIKKRLNPVNYAKQKKYYMLIPNLWFRMAIFLMGFYWIPVIDRTRESHENGRATDEEAGEEAPMVLLMPHSSMFDLIGVSMFSHLTCVARHQVTGIWFISALALLNDPILVKREDENSRKNVINEIKERSKNEQIIMLPEGTNGNRELLLKFKPGAFNPGCPVQTLFIEFNCNDLIFRNIDHITWTWEGPAHYACVYMTLCKLWTSVKITKLPVYYPNSEEQADANLYAANVQKFVCEMTNTRLSLYSFDDVSYLGLCQEAGVPRSPACVKLVKMCNRMCVEEYKRAKREQKEQVDPAEAISTVTQRHIRGGRLEISRNAIDPDSISISSGTGSLELLSQFDEKTRTIECLLQNIDFVASKTEHQPIGPVDTKDNLINFMELHTRYPSALNSSSIEDFTRALKVYNTSDTTASDLLLVMYLCDNRLNAWDRIGKYYSAITPPGQSLTVAQYKNLIWYLLGLEPTVIPDSLFENTAINYQYITDNLVPMFRRAVNENARILITEPMTAQSS